MIIWFLFHLQTIVMDYYTLHSLIPMILHLTLSLEWMNHFHVDFLCDFSFQSYVFLFNKHVLSAPMFVLELHVIFLNLCCTSFRGINSDKNPNLCSDHNKYDVSIFQWKDNMILQMLLHLLFESIAFHCSDVNL